MFQEGSRLLCCCSCCCCWGSCSCCCSSTSSYDIWPVYRYSYRTLTCKKMYWRFNFLFSKKYISNDYYLKIFLLILVVEINDFFLSLLDQNWQILIMNSFPWFNCCCWYLCSCGCGSLCEFFHLCILILQF